ncbi:MAG: ABC transporter permease [Saprospiraceae bacterium]|nr:ABC transporter permease [Saprospiraceae bacterium]
MVRNYFKLALRNLLNNKLYSALNIIGLAVGLAAGVLILLWVSDETSYNKFYKNLPNLYLVMQNQTQGGVTYTFRSTPGPLSEGLRAEIPEIKTVGHSTFNDKHLLTVANNSFYEEGVFAEPEFCQIFNFPVISGDPVAALKDAGSLVLCEQAAKRLFGNQNAIGQTVRYNNTLDLKVGAVLKDIPKNSSIKFEVLLPYGQFKRENSNWINSWGSNGMPTWLELQPNADVAALNKKLENYIQTKHSDAAAHIFAYPIARWRLYNKFENGKQSGGRIDTVILLGLIGIFILLIACINFMNLATARSERRAREVGIRKAIGASRVSIIGQFLSEAMVLTAVALILGLVLARLALPAFNRFYDKEIALDFSNWQLWTVILILGGITGLVAGSYPAFVLSNFQPARVLKGNQLSRSWRKGGLLRKGLVAFQFVIAIFLMISTIVIFRQLEFVQQRPIGYDSENLIEIVSRGTMINHYQALKNELLQLPGVQSVSGGTHDMVSFDSNTSDLQWPGKTPDQDFLVAMTGVDYDWTKTMGVKIVEGRDFSPEYGADTMSCILNQTAVRRMGLKDPVIGTKIISDTAYTVVGVVEDFVFNDAFGVVEPLFVGLNHTNLNSFFVRIKNDGNWKKLLQEMEAVHKKINPAYPFTFKFTKEEYQKNFDEIRQMGQMSNVFGGLAILISCLGLFGLSAFVAERRTKEIGIRKALGASLTQVWISLSQDFIKPVLLAYLLAAPLATWAMNKLLLRFDYRIELAWWMYLAAGLTAIFIAILTVSFQGISAANADPVKSLRNE